MIKVRRGLVLPISGEPLQEIGHSNEPGSVAVLGRDYVGMKPTMNVQVGDRVTLGQVLFTDKKTPAIKFTAPGCGTITEINRGAKRAFLSVVIALDGDDAVEFRQFSATELQQVDPTELVETLVESGAWTAFRTRPFSKIPDPQSRPGAIFVNAMDTNPLAANPDPIIAAGQNDFIVGLNALARLAQHNVYLCQGSDSEQKFNGKELADNVQVEKFSGPHPAGLSGTHIHFLNPVGLNRTVWTINYQDVMAIGRLLVSGKLSTERVISLAGPQVVNPRLVRTRLGVNLLELFEDELKQGENRVISGSVFSGRTAAAAERFLGRYHLQATGLREGRERPLFGYLSPGVKRHSAMGIYISGLLKARKLNFSTSTHGSERAMVPVGNYERVMPLDILPTQLLRALIVGDIESAQNLGALELDEEDLSLCSYVCAGKYDYGPILRNNLNKIEKENFS
jgi:Na+-transporting NADH:ubiquinone oxidoreductase subunit A